ncbi:helix-turn-helix domain-containing protein [Fuscibacter oryzae]|uniref:Helix-turn-helix transcriptional regulator n=1 Tax=Fuscibacter oryzae TaxID=2803939 RepID=A0A8J7MP16_9RHOB|nr:helix-turn-helix transcriptional regulator [Fuscibacter oryzae]MBL4927777.1 helix-turn-helix transcriptional regulator [Fuscibacter oryzae]
MAPAMDRSNEPLVIAFAAALREARLRAGMTQEELAERADVSVRFISLLENGRRQPSLSALAAVSAGLNIPMSMMLAAVEGHLMTNQGNTDGGKEATPEA